MNMFVAYDFALNCITFHVCPNKYLYKCLSKFDFSLYIKTAATQILYVKYSSVSWRLHHSISVV